MSDNKCVKNFADRLEAESAQSLLESNGITSFVDGDDCGGMVPNIAFVTGGFDLIVAESDLQKAEELLADDQS